MYDIFRYGRRAVLIWLLLLLGGGMATAQNASVQFVHTVSDQSSIDLYVNGSLQQDDFAFRSATGFVSLDAGDVEVAVAPGTSTSADDAFETFSVTLEAGQSYVVVASGVTQPDDFSPNPDGRDIGVSLIVSDVRTEANNASTVDLLAVHAVTDAPAINISELGFGSTPFFSDLEYGDVSNYVTINPIDFTIAVTPADVSALIIKALSASLSDQAGEAITLVASGFFSPRTNNNGPSLQLLAVFSDGTVETLPNAEDTSVTSQVQFIHASADRDLLFADIYVDGTLAIDDLRFNTARPYINFIADETVDIGIARQNSASAADTLKNVRLQFDGGQNYTAVLIGLINPSAYAPNPQDLDTGLDLLVAGEARTTPQTPGQPEFRVLNALTDGPPLTLGARGVGKFTENLAYGELSAYASVPSQTYLVDIISTQAPAWILNTANVNFSQLQRSFTFIITGFVDRFKNQVGAAPKLFAVYEDGFTAEFEQPTLTDQTARVQFFHASPDPNLPTVDVYLGDGLLFDDFSFPSGERFITVASDTPVNIGIAPPSSAGVDEALISFPATFEAQTLYTAVLVGVADPAFFAPNPSGVSTELDLVIEPGAREAPIDPNESAFKVIYAVPDGPAVDIFIDGVVALSEEAPYKTISDYVSLPSTGGYRLDFSPRDSTNRLLRAMVDFTNVGSRAMTIVLTGFVDELANQGGPGLTLFGTYPDGFEPDIFAGPTPIEKPGAELPERFALQGNYPNPFNPTTSVVFDLPDQALVGVDVFDVTGRKVLALPARLVPAGAGQTVQIDASGLSSGLYFYQVSAETVSSTLRASGRMTIVK